MPNQQPKKVNHNFVTIEQLSRILKDAVEMGDDFKLEIRHPGNFKDEFYVFIIHKNIARSKTI